MNSQFTSSYDVDNRYRFYKSLDPKSDISKRRRGVRPGVDDGSKKNFLRAFINNLNHLRQFNTLNSQSYYHYDLSLIRY